MDVVFFCWPAVYADYSSTCSSGSVILSTCLCPLRRFLCILLLRGALLLLRALTAQRRACWL